MIGQLVRRPWFAGTATIMMPLFMMLVLHDTLLLTPAYAQFFGIQHDAVESAIVGEDIVFEARITGGDADQVAFNIRRLADLGEFARYPMEKVDERTYRFVLELSQEPVSSRLEYYIEAFDDSEPVAQTPFYTISFIKRPQVGEPNVVTTAKLDKGEWKILLRGGKRPLWKKWWFWAIGAVVVAGVVAATSGGGGTEDTYDPPTVALTILTEPVTGNFYSPGDIVTQATVQGGEALYTLNFYYQMRDQDEVLDGTYTFDGVPPFTQNHTYSFPSTGLNQFVTLRVEVIDGRANPDTESREITVLP